MWSSRWLASFLLILMQTEVFPLQLRDLHFADYENFLLELAGFQVSEAHSKHDSA